MIPRKQEVIFPCRQKQPRFLFSKMLFLLAFCFVQTTLCAQATRPAIGFAISMKNPASHDFQVELSGRGWPQDTIEFKLPNWTPGYYQLMDYAKNIGNIRARDQSGKTISVKKINGNTWQVAGVKAKAFKLFYTVRADRQFVANPFLDSTRAYLVPAGLFLYAKGWLHLPVTLTLALPAHWNKVATGLQPVAGKKNEFRAPDFDVFYDSPLLAGSLEELPPFYVQGVAHRFIGYKLGAFDRQRFMQNLERVVQAAVAVIGDIPYKQYTFIGIGPGRGGIEHLNSTTVSFDGSELTTEAGMNTMMNFLAHEYFHHYNVKRIRPLELGPFDYDHENRTNLLWLSEGLSVYYEYLVVKRAGLCDEKTLFQDFESSLNAFENDPGRSSQSLVQASYQTWQEGPFGNKAAGSDQSISYYEKGPLVGLLLDFAIRHATGNKGSLDDVMRQLYWQYYKGLRRGVTDAEVQQACERIAGTSLAPLFDYVYTTKELDYNTYLGYAGLKVDVATEQKSGKRKFSLHRLEKMTTEQAAVLQAWLGR